MNEKKCKSLRRIARTMTVGRPEAVYRAGPTGTIRLRADCIRAEYRRLKREARRAG